MRNQPQISLILLLALCYSACDRENLDELVEETVETIEPEVTDYAPDHVYFHDNGYVSSDWADASECEGPAPFSTELTNYYLITNLEDHGGGIPYLENEGDFYLEYNLETEIFHHANILVDIAGELKEACPFELEMALDTLGSNGQLIGTFQGEFFVYDNNIGEWVTIGDLSGNFHVPMVDCQ